MPSHYVAAIGVASAQPDAQARRWPLSAQTRHEPAGPSGEHPLCAVIHNSQASRLEQVGDEHSERVHKITSIAPDDAMILPHDANLRRMKLSERTRKLGHLLAVGGVFQKFVGRIHQAIAQAASCI
jgi:hypothetical protein